MFLFQPFGFSEACQTCERLLSAKREEGVAWRCLGELKMTFVPLLEPFGLKVGKKV